MASTFECLGLRFGAEIDDPVARALVDDFYRPCRVDGSAERTFALTTDTAGEEPVFVVRVDGHEVKRTERRHLALAHLVWEISQYVIETAPGPGRVLLHAAAAADDRGGAVVLPAASGSGKSTLVASLVATGLGYLTDDLAVLDGASGLLQPYPKPISTPVRLRRKLPGRGAASIAPERYDWLGDEGFATAADLGGTVAGPARPRLVVSPRYVPNSRLTVRELSRAETVRLLAEQSFAAATYGPDLLPRLAEVVGECRCYAIEYADLDEAASFVREELARCAPA